MKMPNGPPTPPDRNMLISTALTTSTAIPETGPNAKAAINAGISPGSYFKYTGNVGRGTSRYIKTNANAPKTAICVIRFTCPTTLWRHCGAGNTYMKGWKGYLAHTRHPREPSTAGQTFSHPDSTVGSGFASRTTLLPPPRIGGDTSVRWIRGPDPSYPQKAVASRGLQLTLLPPVGNCPSGRRTHPAPKVAM